MPALGERPSLRRNPGIARPDLELRAVARAAARVEAEVRANDLDARARAVGREDKLLLHVVRAVPELQERAVREDAVLDVQALPAERTRVDRAPSGRRRRRRPGRLRAGVERIGRVRGHAERDLPAGHGRRRPRAARARDATIGRLAVRAGRELSGELDSSQQTLRDRITEGTDRDRPRRVGVVDRDKARATAPERDLHVVSGLPVDKRSTADDLAEVDHVRDRRPAVLAPEAVHPTGAIAGARACYIPSTIDANTSGAWYIPPFGGPSSGLLNWYELSTVGVPYGYASAKTVASV
jgi:hypothetical protein